MAALRQLYRFMSPWHRQRFSRLFALMLLGGLAELLMIAAVVPFLSLLSGADGGQPWLAPLFTMLGAEGSGERLRVGAGLFMIAAALVGIVRLRLAWSSQHAVLGFAHELSVAIQRRILLQPYSYHLEHNSSEVVASLEMVQGLVGAVLMQLMQAVAAAFISLFIIAALIHLDPFTALLAAVAFGGIYALVSLVTRARLARNSKIVGASYERRVQLVQESLGGIRDIIIDHSHDTYVDEFRTIDARFTRARVTTAFMGAAPRFMIEAAGFVVIALLALILADREGSLAGALPILGGLAIGAQRLLPLSQQLYQAWVHFTGNQAVLERVQRLLELPVDPATEAENPVPLPFASEVRLEKVSFSYPGAPSPAIDRVSLNIPRGSRVALVGRTGSGKTTLADLLMGLIAPQAGRITIDGTTLDATSRRAWQQCIAHVPQTVFLADTSIARNIAFGVPEDRIDREWVREAAIQSQLHEHIASLPRGYDTLVGERGARLSGGQRQRLGLARAIYKRAPLLVLDEATNALDPLTEQAVLGSLDALGRKGRTIVIVAHSAATIAGCDLVFRLEKGRLV